MIDIRKLKELVKLMVENDLAELDLKDQEETVTIKRAGSASPEVFVAPVARAHAEPAPEASSSPSEAPDESGLVAIESPMVGTFYSSPNPDSDAYVQVGSSISSDSVVCLVEAMKVFNEIKAEMEGTVVSILIENGQTVEYGQPMFLVKPN